MEGHVRFTAVRFQTLFLSEYKSGRCRIFWYIEMLNSDKFYQCYPNYGSKGTAVIGNPTL